MKQDGNNNEKHQGFHKFLWSAMKYLILFVIGGCTYYGFELLFRGWSDPSMFFLGAVVYIFAGIQNEGHRESTPLITQTFKTWVFTLAAEFLTGCVVNLAWGWHIWDYSNMPGNILGQSTWQFWILFWFLDLFAIWWDDCVRHILFKEPWPKYRLR